MHVVIASADPEAGTDAVTIPLSEYTVQASDFAVLPRHVATGETYREWAQKLANNGAAVCLCICPEKKKFLLDLRGPNVQHPGTYGLPGGALEDDESPTAGALRELYEETGKRIRKADSVIKIADGLWCVIVTVSKLFDPRISVESAELKWFSKLPPKSKLHPAMRKSYAMYAELIGTVTGESPIPEPKKSKPVLAERTLVKKQTPKQTTRIRKQAA